MRMKLGVMFPDLLLMFAFTVSVTSAPVTGGYGGIIEITSAPPNTIHTLLIGGQELGIDNVMAIPEPSALAMMAVGLSGIALFGWWRRHA